MAEANDRTFPTLTDRQIERLDAAGRRRAIDAGEVLVAPGDRNVPFFVVLSGQIEVIAASGNGRAVAVTHHAKQFSGEGNVLTGRPSLAELRVREAGEVIQVARERLLALIQVDAELSQILMRAFILRRAMLMAVG